MLNKIKQYWSNMKKGFEALRNYALVWLLCTIPSFITMGWIYVKDLPISSPSVFGIKTNEILIYAISFSTPILSFCFIKTHINSLWKFFAFIAFVVSFVFFCWLKDDSAQLIEQTLFAPVLILYGVSVLLGLIVSVLLAYPPGPEYVEEKKEEKLKNINSDFDNILNNRNLSK